MKSLKVKDIMTRDVITVHTDTSLAEVVSLLQQYNIGGVPVVDATGHLLGIVTETDLFLKEKGVPFSSMKMPSLLGEFADKQTLAHFQERAKEIPVKEVMTTDVITVDEETSTEDVAMLMYQKELTCVPVIKEGKVVGIVTRVDVLRAIYNANKKE